MRINKLSVLATFAGLGLLAAGCVSDLDRVAKVRQKPEWAVRGSGAFKGKDNAVFYGLGIANAMPNTALQHKAADLRAREAVASTLKQSVRNMANDLMQNHADLFNPEGKASAEEVIKSTTQGVTDAELANCRIIDYWEDPKSGELFALAKLDLNAGFYGSYKENLARALRENGGATNIKQTEAIMNALDKAVTEQQTREGVLTGATQTAAPIGALEDPK